MNDLSTDVSGATRLPSSPPITSPERDSRSGTSRRLRPLVFGLAVLSVVAFVLVAAGGAHAEDGGKADDPAPVGPRVSWLEEGVEQEAGIALDRIAVVDDGGRGELHVSRLSPAAVDVEGYREALLRRAEELAHVADTDSVVGAVLYQGDRERATRLIAVGDVLVQFSSRSGSAERRALTDPLGLQRASGFAFSDDTYLFRSEDPLAAIEAARALGDSPLVEWAVPSFLRPRTERAVPDDPLFGMQWHLRNTGQRSGTAGYDLNVTSVWDQTVGGVPLRGTPDEVIAIADDGVEIGHPDLAANVVPGRSWDWADADGDPSPSRAWGDGQFHGTACAGVAAARGFNGLGVSGVAPAAGLVGYKFLISGVDSDAVEAEVLAAVRPDPGNRDVVDIVNNSWGPYDDRHLEGPGPLVEAALQDGVANGRDGRGLIYVWAAGNGRQEDDDVNFDGFANSRYTIAVGSITNRGTVAPYSEDGAPLMVVAPSSDGIPGDAARHHDRGRDRKCRVRRQRLRQRFRRHVGQRSARERGRGADASGESRAHLARRSGDPHDDGAEGGFEERRLEYQRRRSRRQPHLWVRTRGRCRRRCGGRRLAAATRRADDLGRRCTARPHTGRVFIRRHKQHCPRRRAATTHGGVCGGGGHGAASLLA